MSLSSRGSAGVASALLVAVIVSGCGGGGGDKRASVSGKVSFDGQPVEEGQITFTPADEKAKGTVTGATIKGGTYTVPKEEGPIVGAHKVSIRASRKTGKQIPAVAPAQPGTMIDVMEEYIPTQYNFQTTLTADIKAGENPNVDFSLTK